MATQTIKMKIQFRRDIAANWELYKNEIPAAGEPCFEIDTGILKIGDGETTYGELKAINGVSLSADGNSIVLENGVFKLAGFDATKIGAQPRVAADGSLEWIVPSNELHTVVTTLQSDVKTLKDDVAGLKAIVGSSDSGSTTLLSRIEELEKEMNTFITGVGDNDEKINTLIELVEYIDKHGKEAADITSRIDDLYGLVGSGSVADQIIAAVETSEKKSAALYEHVKYEVSHKPVGTLVDYRDKEIRIMVPSDTEFAHQNSGVNANANMYYIGFKAYAPDGAASFKEDQSEIIVDNTMHYFINNEFAGIDAYGRKYSIVWLPVAYYADGAWTYYGAKSSKSKYIGWHYSVEWYDANGVIIASDCIRINLSNEKCHNNIEPYYMANVIKEVSVNGTLLDMVDGKVNIAIDNVIKSSDEIVINKDGSLSIKSISFDKVAQDDDTVLVMDGGSAV